MAAEWKCPDTLADITGVARWVHRLQVAIASVVLAWLLLELFRWASE